MPPKNQNQCTEIGELIKNKLNDFGFKNIEINCIGLGGDDVGSHVATFRAYHSNNYLAEETIAPRRYGSTAETSCQKDLEEIKVNIPNKYLLEANCFYGIESSGNTKFYQARLVRFFKVEPSAKKNFTLDPSKVINEP